MSKKIVREGLISKFRNFKRVNYSLSHFGLGGNFLLGRREYKERFLKRFPTFFLIGWIEGQGEIYYS